MQCSCTSQNWGRNFRVIPEFSSILLCVYWEFTLSMFTLHTPLISSWFALVSAAADFLLSLAIKIWGHVPSLLLTTPSAPLPIGTVSYKQSYPLAPQKKCEEFSNIFHKHLRDQELPKLQWNWLLTPQRSFEILAHTTSLIFTPSSSLTKKLLPVCFSLQAQFYQVWRDVWQTNHLIVGVDSFLQHLIASHFLS